MTIPPAEINIRRNMMHQARHQATNHTGDDEPENDTVDLPSPNKKQCGAASHAAQSSSPTTPPITTPATSSRASSTDPGECSSGSLACASPPPDDDDNDGDGDGGGAAQVGNGASDPAGGAGFDAGDRRRHLRKVSSLSLTGADRQSQSSSGRASASASGAAPSPGAGAGAGAGAPSASSPLRIAHPTAIPTARSLALANKPPNGRPPPSLGLRRPTLQRRPSTSNPNLLKSEQQAKSRSTMGARQRPRLARSGSISDPNLPVRSCLKRSNPNLLIIKNSKPFVKPPPRRDDRTQSREELANLMNANVIDWNAVRLVQSKLYARDGSGVPLLPNSQQHGGFPSVRALLASSGASLASSGSGRAPGRNASWDDVQPPSSSGAGNPATGAPAVVPKARPPQQHHQQQQQSADLTDPSSLSANKNASFGSAGAAAHATKMSQQRQQAQQHEAFQKQQPYQQQEPLQRHHQAQQLQQQQQQQHNRPTVVDIFAQAATNGERSSAADMFTRLLNCAVVAPPSPPPMPTAQVTPGAPYAPAGSSMDSNSSAANTVPTSNLFRGGGLVVPRSSGADQSSGSVSDGGPQVMSGAASFDVADQQQQQQQPSVGITHGPPGGKGGSFGSISSGGSATSGSSVGGLMHRQKSGLRLARPKKVRAVSEGGFATLGTMTGMSGGLLIPPHSTIPSDSLTKSASAGSGASLGIKSTASEPTPSTRTVTNSTMTAKSTCTKSVAAKSVSAPSLADTNTSMKRARSGLVLVRPNKKRGLGGGAGAGAEAAGGSDGSLGQQQAGAGAVTKKPMPSPFDLLRRSTSRGSED